MALPASDRADAFHALHAPGRILVLPNAWDVGSARLIESLGAEAIATTSAGVAWARGYSDGQALPFRELLDVAAAIGRAVAVPLSVDFEAGYATDPATVAEHAAALIGAGAVGVNLEDGRESPDATAAKIEAVRKAAEREGVRLFVNARTDVFLKKLVPRERAVEEALARGARYRDAGASGLFVPRAKEPADIRAIVAGIELPVNALAMPGLPPVAELRALGVRRVSAGAGVSLAALAAAKEGVEELLAAGRYERMFSKAGSIEMNALLARR